MVYLDKKFEKGYILNVQNRIVQNRKKVDLWNNILHIALKWKNYM